MTRKIIIKTILVLGLVALFGLGLGVRRVVLDAQRSRSEGMELPFTRESALMFLHVRTLYKTGTLPERDSKVQTPEGVVIRETYMIFAEYVYAGLAHLLPSSLSLAERVRWVALACFCLGIPFLALWVWRLWGSVIAAGFAGVYYAVGLASVSRSTGQELSDENFALPLLIGHLAMGAWAESRSGRVLVAGSAASALLFGCALGAWDLVQFYVMIWAGTAAIQWLRQRLVGPAKLHWLFCLCVLILTSLINPYLRSHMFAASYSMLLAYGVVAGMVIEAWLKTPMKKIWNYFMEGGRPRPPGLRRRRPVALQGIEGNVPSHFPPKSGCLNGMPFFAPAVPGWLARAWRPAVILLPLLLIPWFIDGYGEAYGHFTELLWAKLRFLNQKPADPALLTFDQRLLWAPALESVNLKLTIILFPVILCLSFFAFAGILFLSYRRSIPGVFQLLFGFIVSLLAFLLFKRFHVFLAIYVAALFGWLVRWAVELKWAFPRWCMLGVLAFGLVIESAWLLQAPKGFGGDYYYRESDGLTRWLRENTGRETVLGPFALSAFIRADADCPIVLHPKFESPEIRRRVKAYYETLFLGDEQALRDWAGQYGANYYVYPKGAFKSSNQRYFANALDPPSNAVARLMELEPENLRYFKLLWGNIRYSVFRIITATDEADAINLANEAEKDRLAGRAGLAKDKACLALISDPGCQVAVKVLMALTVTKNEIKSRAEGDYDNAGVRDRRNSLRQEPRGRIPKGGRNPGR